MKMYVHMRVEKSRRGTYGTRGMSQIRPAERGRALHLGLRKMEEHARVSSFTRGPCAMGLVVVMEGKQPREDEGYNGTSRWLAAWFVWRATKMHRIDV